MGTQTNQQQHQFINAILETFHLKMDVFFYNIVHHHRYEIIMYLWITKLYTQGKSIDHAIQILYKARNRFMLPNCYQKKS
ncbi:MULTISPECIES: hypothetical protein [Aquimarina]|uniref:hypothetical protein n=1 Tax=Aquimarina TaxID=290174 RepID=UPI0011C4876B|nr:MULTISPECIES: hypothetical protein [Aquimarina]